MEKIIIRQSGMAQNATPRRLMQVFFGRCRAEDNACKLLRTIQYTSRFGKPQTVAGPSAIRRPPNGGVYRATAKPVRVTALVLKKS